MSLQAKVVEGKAVPVQTDDGSTTAATVRVFQLELNGVIVELSSLGASITKLLLPKANDSSGGHDDIVLGYLSPQEMYESKNPPYFGVVVGRVANRIAKGKFTLGGQEYGLAINNGPNHLHGGLNGFSHCIWDAKLVDVPAADGITSSSTTTAKGVQFSLTSPNGDQGYPGNVFVTATYTLVPSQDQQNSATLRLQMQAQLKDDKPTPISLAQHTYFNLAKHNEPQGILDHKISLNCDSYTPTDATSIPTREVVKLNDDVAMDLRNGKVMREALKTFGVAKAKLEESVAIQHVTKLSRIAPATAKSSDASPTPNETYGFDHNYVVTPSPTTMTGSHQHSLSLVGTLDHEASKRRMKVYSNAPGVQVYTGNYLDGTVPSPKICKEGAAYGQWQSICLETQYFPDSILSPQEEKAFPAFAKGKCPILVPGGPDYEHTVEYAFETF